MIASLDYTRSLAVRIRRGYVRRRPWWPSSDPFASAWTLAAMSLVEAHRADPRLPLDPELFVASQPVDDRFADPWGELVGPAAERRYRRRVLRIARRLRRELLGELRRIKVLARRGLPLDRVLRLDGPDLSPLGRYVAAVRAGRHELAKALREEALQQHRSCPLYQLACRDLLPEGSYPAAFSQIPLSPLPAGAAARN